MQIMEKTEGAYVHNLKKIKGPKGQDIIMVAPGGKGGKDCWRMSRKQRMGRIWKLESLFCEVGISG